MSIIFSGTQPSGRLHLGNYLGAITTWKQLQQSHDCTYCVVDLHALTMTYDPKILQQSILETIACFLACDIDPKHIVIQSSNPNHAELAWILSCNARIGWLNRMIQFKEKAKKNTEQASVGLYTYPILMTADIFLYKATHVPVGEDQIQHIELARDIAICFNQRYGPCFVPPQAILNHNATRVMSLRDGTKKMSKSDQSDYSRIHLSDSADTIVLKIKKAKTDPYPIPSSFQELQERPEARNLLKIYQALTEQNDEKLFSSVSGKDFQYLKSILTDALVDKICPIGEKIKMFMKNPDYLTNLAENNTKNAIKSTTPIMENIKQKIGLSCLFK